MATDYPIEIDDLGGGVRIAGLANFTDPDNAPVGPGASVTVEDIDSESSSAGEVLTSDGDGTASWAAGGGGSDGLLSIAVSGGLPFAAQSPLDSSHNSAAAVSIPPFLIAAMGNVCDIPQVFPADVPDISDDIDCQANLYVTDQTGTNTLLAQGSSSQATPISGPGTPIDWSGVSPTIVGVDLTWDGAGGVTSTAGGVYSVALTAICSPD